MRTGIMRGTSAIHQTILIEAKIEIIITIIDKITAEIMTGMRINLEIDCPISCVDALDCEMSAISTHSSLIFN
ncbi:MAG: hypothetical protein GY816_08780 [Cytophagales bacterium]|nr:hypothetical protein [Cytophagales bacterium]